MNGELHVSNLPTFRCVEVCRIAGVTYRQMDYWIRTGLVVPSVAEAQGSGTQRLFSFNDLVQVVTIKKLLDAGVSLQRARACIEYMGAHFPEDWEGVVLVVTDGNVFAVGQTEDVLDVLREYTNAVLVSLDAVRRELDERLLVAA